ncbi:DUF6412 domain-containing protein [Rathayibacter sp. YIM 133350]|uniref:DUF6412 domain-containing protein n=1 Tax=Rathayibacter sp. YIM 133350 TaxID=3131992 RepID=UPI00307F2AE8
MLIGFALVLPSLAAPTAAAGEGSTLAAATLLLAVCAIAAAAARLVSSTAAATAVAPVRTAAPATLTPLSAQVDPDAPGHSRPRAPGAAR